MLCTIWILGSLLFSNHSPMRPFRGALDVIQNRYIVLLVEAYSDFPTEAVTAANAGAPLSGCRLSKSVN